MLQASLRSISVKACLENEELANTDSTQQALAILGGKFNSKLAVLIILPSLNWVKKIEAIALLKLLQKLALLTPQWNLCMSR